MDVIRLKKLSNNNEGYDYAVVSFNSDGTDGQNPVVNKQWEDLTKEEQKRFLKMMMLPLEDSPWHLIFVLNPKKFAKKLKLKANLREKSL